MTPTHDATGRFAQSEHWRGTAKDLADICNRTLTTIPTLSAEAGAANERLIRHYVQAGVLSPPQREGREALFGQRQLLEFLAARHLLHDGWPLSKVAELLRGTDHAALLQIIPIDRPRTRAEEVVAHYRAAAEKRPARELAMAALAAPPADRRRAAPATGASRPAHGASTTPSLPLERAARLLRSKSVLEEDLRQLGNSTGRVGIERLLRISLTPWCHVQIEADKLRDLSDDTVETLGRALQHALQAERNRRGDPR
jgi:DNA-binding transcriptional MerR regulator